MLQYWLEHHDGKTRGRQVSPRRTTLDSRVDSRFFSNRRVDSRAPEGLLEPGYPLGVKVRRFHGRSQIPGFPVPTRRLGLAASPIDPDSLRGAAFPHPPHPFPLVSA